jgi:hypothetical protein
MPRDTAPGGEQSARLGTEAIRHRRRRKKPPRPHDVRERGGPLEKRAEGSCGGP